jgi:hypothetical protein
MPVLAMVSHHPSAITRFHDELCVCVFLGGGGAVKGWSGASAYTTAAVHCAVTVSGSDCLTSCALIPGQLTLS